MAGMIHGDDRVGAGIDRAHDQVAMDRLLARLELRGLAAAGIGEARILRQLDQLEVGHGAQQGADALDRGADPLMLVDHDAALGLVRLEARLQRIQVRGKELAHMAHVERRFLDVLLQLVEILGAGRAPGQHLGGAGLAEALEGAMAHALVSGKVGFLELVDAAAMGGAADHVEVEFQRVEDVHDVQHDVRRAQHVAARVEQHVGGAPLGRRQDLLQRLGRQLHAGEQAHGLRHVAEASGGIGRAFLHRARRLQRLHLGDGHPLADVDALGTGGGALGAAVTGTEPLVEQRRRGPALARERQEFADTLDRPAGVEPAFACRRTGLEALAAARTAIGRLGGQCFQPVGIGAHQRWPCRLLYSSSSCDGLRPTAMR